MLAWYLEAVWEVAKVFLVAMPFALVGLLVMIWLDRK